MDPSWEVFEATTTTKDTSQQHRRNSSSSDPSTSHLPLHVKQALAANKKYVDDGIDEHSVTPMVAFEVFAGKQFTTVGGTVSTDLSDSVSKNKNIAIENEKRRIRNSIESPLERYHRLKFEVDALAEDVRAMNDTSENKDSAATMPNAPWQEMSQGLFAMQSQLSTIADTKSMKAIGLSVPNATSIHSVLSSRLLSEVERMRKSTGQKDGNDTVADTNVDLTDAATLMDGSTSRTTYEVHLDTGKYSSEGAAREWSTVVDISIHPPSFKPVSLLSPRSPLSKTPKQVFFNPINIFDIFYHSVLLLSIYFFV